MRALLPGPSLLFCPADRPDRYAKAAAAADAVILDLEDAVRADRRAEARQALVSTPLDPERVVVRVSPVGTADHEQDLVALRETRYRMLMLPKAERVSDVVAVAPWQVVVLCETPHGVLRCEELAAAPNTIGLMWGAEDLVVALGGRSSRRPDGSYRAFARHARAKILFAARAYRRYAIDAVNLRLDDLDSVAAEAVDAAASGFTHKACIHPSHADAIRTSYLPDQADVAQARRIVAAAAGGGVATMDGRMIDEPLVRQARETLRRAGEPVDGASPSY